MIFGVSPSRDAVVIVETTGSGETSRLVRGAQAVAAQVATLADPGRLGRLDLSAIER